MFSFTVLPEEQGQTLVEFLKKKLQLDYSARAIKRMIENNSCEVNGQVERFANTLLGTGDRIVLHLPDEPFHVHFSPSTILYNDGDLLILDKPSGVISDLQFLGPLLPEHTNSLTLAHRLDKETSGALILVKNPIAEAYMKRQFQLRLIQKQYLAIVDGQLKAKQGRIENYLHKKKDFAGQSIWGETNEKKGKFAATDWSVVKQSKDCSLVRCYPKTGRTHQIRVHMSGLGHPIIGDHQYGAFFRCKVKAPRTLLHAHSLSFQHPTSQEQLHIVSQPPDDFQKFWDQMDR